MTKIEELEQKLREASSGFEFVINEIRKELVCHKTQKELKESKKEGKWKPQIGEEYWFRDGCGNMEFFHYDTNHKGDRWRIDNLPVFPTKEACERYWRFMDTVKEKSYEFSKEEWADETVEKWFVNYEYRSKRFYPDNFLGTKMLGTIYFATREDAQYIIDNFKDELMKFFI